MDRNNPASAVKPANQSFQGIWGGDSKIVVGIDIGTTYSGVAYTFLVEGGKKVLHRVNHYPGQLTSHSKVPSLIWYNSDGEPQLFGAEAQSPEAEAEAEENGWELARYFKLHLHPPELRARYNLTLERLPTKTPLSKVYSDFMRYLLEQSQRSFETRVMGGENIWRDYRSNLEVIIAHPNGYRIQEQAFLRSAALEAGFTTHEKARSNIHFVTEAEASVHFCLHYTDLASRLEPGMNFAVCDAGGSTVDTTLYTVHSISPQLHLGEDNESDCIQAGAIFVDKLAESYLGRLFEDTQLSQATKDDYTLSAIKDFEVNAKRTFHEVNREYFVKVAGLSVSQPSPRIRRGKLMLPGSIIESFFTGCVNDILESVALQVQGRIVPYVLLVGGFGESPYICQQLRTRLQSLGTQVSTTDEQASKSVADGALIWHCMSSVIKRVPHLSFGVGVTVPFDPDDAEHCQRTRYERPAGIRVRGGWSQIVRKGIPIDSDTISRQSYRRSYWNPNPDLENFSDVIYGYSDDDSPNWLQTNSGLLQDGFQRICTVSTNLNSVRNALTSGTNAHGAQFWFVSFNICIQFGGTELEAFIEWEEGGNVKKGPVTIVPIT